MISPALLRADDFRGFMDDRQARLLRLIGEATGKAAYQSEEVEDDAETDVEMAEAELTMGAS